MKPSKQTSWSDQIPRIRYPRLQNNIVADVAIVGGGIAGLLSAYLLANAGKKVVILEKGDLLSGTTMYTTAFLSQIIDTSAVDMTNIYGKRNAALIWESHGEAINLIERIVKEENIECEFMRCNDYSYINDQDESKDLQEEYEGMKKLGAPVSLKKKNDLGFPQHGYVELANQGKFHPIKFLRKLLLVLAELEVLIYEQTEVEKVSSTKFGVIAKGEGFSVKAGHAITATYDPLNNPIKTFMKKGMYVSYVYELEIAKGLFKEGIYEDSNNPYHYFRIDRMGMHDRMIIGGEDNRKEIAFGEQKNFRALKAYTNKLLGKNPYRIVHKWSGQILEPSDGLALIGQFKQHQLVATAFSGNGMTYSGIAAKIFCDAVCGRKNKYAKLYNPARIPTIKQLYTKGRDYTEEFINAAAKNTFKY